MSKNSYGSWREIQDEYDNYMASLKFESAKEIREFLEEEYTALKSDAKAQIDNFVATDTQSIEITRYLN